MTFRQRARSPAAKRAEFLDRLPRPTRPLAELLYEELDAMVALQSEAQKAMLAEAKRHPAFRLVKSCPSLGPVRTAELLPIVVNALPVPEQARVLVALWPGDRDQELVGLGENPDGRVGEGGGEASRGLNRNFNHTLKLTIARQIASIVLAVWRAGEVYDPKRLEAASRSG